MRTYKSTLNDLTQILQDALNLAEEHDTPETSLIHIDCKRLVDLSQRSEIHGAANLTSQLTELNLFSDESGARRRKILDTDNFEYQGGAFNTTVRDVLSSYRTKASCSFLFLNSKKKFVHLSFTIDNEKQKIVRLSVNETIYNENDPSVIGSINTLNHLERAYNTLTEYK